MKKSFLPAVLLVLVVLVLISVVFYQRDNIASLYIAEVEKRQQLENDLLAIAEADFTVGASSPRVRLLVYTDGDCQYCRKFEPRFERLLSTYPEDIAITYRHFKLATFPNSRYEHIALECVGILTDAVTYRQFQNQVIFENQFVNEGDYLESATKLAEDFMPASRVGEVRACMENPATLERISRKVNSGNVLGVQQTPTFYLIDGDRHQKYVGSMEYDLLLSVINEFLGEGNELN